MKSDIKGIARKPVQITTSERPIIDALKLYRSGSDDPAEEPLIKASDLLKEITNAVAETGQKGELTIAIKLAGEGKNIAVQVEVKAKKPIRKPIKRLLFAADNGEIVQHDPDQYSFEDQLLPSKTAAA
jgi:hypothetical protein